MKQNKFPGWKKVRIGAIIREDDLITARNNVEQLAGPVEVIEGKLGFCVPKHLGKLGDKLDKSYDNDLLVLRKV
jgi:hypothetical protein